MERSLALRHQVSKKGGDFEAQLVGTGGEDNHVQAAGEGPVQLFRLFAGERLMGVSSRLLYR
jgi:hypothetical protein